MASQWLTDETENLIFSLLRTVVSWTQPFIAKYSITVYLTTSITVVINPIIGELQLMVITVNESLVKNTYNMLTKTEKSLTMTICM